MKKIFFILMIVSMAFSLATLGCSKNSSSNNDNNNTAGPNFNPDDYDYYFAVFRNGGLRDSYAVSVMPSDSTNVIESVTLSVNGTNVEMAAVGYINAWYGTYEFNQGDNYEFNLNIDGIAYNYNLQIASQYNVNWPENYNPAEATELTWIQQTDCDYQDFNLDGDGSEDKTQVLETSARSFTIPANWIGTTYNIYTLEFWGINYKEVNGKMLVTSDELSSRDYYNFGKSQKEEISYQQHLEKLLENLPRIIK